MKKIFTLIVLAGLFASCSINSPEPEIADETDAYEAIGTLLIPSSG